MNRLLDRETLTKLLSKRDGPCLSVYQPTHRSFAERQRTVASSTWSSSWKNHSTTRPWRQGTHPARAVRP